MQILDKRKEVDKHIVVLSHLCHVQTINHYAALIFQNLCSSNRAARMLQTEFILKFQRSALCYLQWTAHLSVLFLLSS